MPIFQSARGNLHYEQLGDGRPILLLHGFTNFGLSWAPQLAPLVHSGHRIIVPDLRGHGRSAPATALCTVSELATDMAGLLDHLNIPQLAVCGLSLGGMVAQQLAVDQPVRVSELIIVNSRSSFTGPEIAALVDGWITLFRETHGQLKRLQATWPALLNDGFRESPSGRAAFKTWSQVLASVSGASLCHIARGMTQFDLSGRLTAVRVPTLVICGEHDRLFRPEEGQKIADEIVGSVYKMISGAGHLCNLDSTDQFNRLLLEHLH